MKLKRPKVDLGILYGDRESSIDTTNKQVHPNKSTNCVMERFCNT